MPDVRITLLGGFGVVVDGRGVPAAQWRRRQAAALVKILALAPGRALHRERVIDALWPGLEVGEAAPRLHKAAHYARRTLGDAGSLVLGGESVALCPGAAVDIDACRFERLAEAALAAGDPRAAGRAADTYTGDLLPDDPYEPWTTAPRERFRLLHSRVLRLAERWETLAEAEPGDEQAHLVLIRRRADAGDRRGALRQFRQMERELRRELGVSPSTAALRLRDELIGEGRAARSGTPAVALVGRGPEQARIDRLLDAARQGRGRILFLAGAAGVGKSALLARVETAAAGRRMRIGRGAAARIEGDWPYAPVLEALADLSRQHPSLLDGLDDAFREEIERALSGRQFSWDGRGAHQRLFIAVAELVGLASAGEGAVLVVDDVHDADEGSLRLLHYLARTAVTQRLLIAVGHRPVRSGTLAEVRRSLLARGSAVPLDLAPLQAPDAAALARRLVPRADPVMLDAIGQASGGLPFAILEIARGMAAEGPGRAAGTLVPAALSERARRALSAAAVLGSTVDADEFAGVTGLSDDDADAVLEQAVELRVLHRAEAGYAFRHALVREALLEAAGPDGRREAHRAAARTLERLGRSPARIGHHLVQGGREKAAVGWLLTAAETQAALGAYRDALATLETVSAAASGPDRARLLTLRADLLTACADLGAVDAYRDALRAVSDPAARKPLLTRLARAATTAGDLETAEVAVAGLDLDGSDNDAALLLMRGNLAYYRNDYAAAEEAAAEARRRVALGGQSWRLFDLIALQGLLAHHRGEWFQRLRGELRNVMRRPDLAVGIFDSHLCVAEFLLYGPTPYDEVMELARQLRDTAERAGVPRAVAFATALRGEAALLKGDLTLAETELRAAAGLHHDLESPTGEAHCLERLAEVELARGDRAAAGLLLHRALPLARWSIIGQHLLQRVWGTMIMAAPGPEAARAVVDRAEATFVAEDSCSFCVIMFAVPAACACADVGDLAEARHYLARAETSEAMWEGTAWQASLLEVRAHIARADHDDSTARRLFGEAAAQFEAAGHPLDAQRCRA
ncbi:ATP-binding protein [Actinoplanes sp. CA-030573]|uniref:ATP-binding protein n=1 Tax=Actinoplanes sp. CA-030573 TaxID=3239898 RepID=UPI003D8C72A0